MPEAQLYRPVRGNAEKEMRRLLQLCSLRIDRIPEETVLLYDGDAAVATASRDGGVLRYVAVDPSFEGEGACARMLSLLIASAAEQGITELLLFTKPENERLFASLGFYGIIESPGAVLMENHRDGLEAYLSSLPEGKGSIGAVVMNADPFTNGHLHLCRKASELCDFLYVFILSEETSRFSAAMRLSMAKEALINVPNAHVCPAGKYMISAATFPLYFIKDELKAEEIQADLDVLLFAKLIAPALKIEKRFVGTEPFCPFTARYNERLQAILPEYGIELITVPRKDGISAKTARLYVETKEFEKLRTIVPPSSYEQILRQLS